MNTHIELTDTFGGEANYAWVDRHSFDCNGMKWCEWNTPAGRKWINSMDAYALAWADKWMDLVLTIIDHKFGETK